MRKISTNYLRHLGETNQIMMIEGPRLFYTLGYGQEVSVHSVREVRESRLGLVGSRTFSAAPRAACEDWLTRAGFRILGKSTQLDAVVYGRSIG